MKFVRIELDPLEKFKSELQQGLADPGAANEVRGAVKKWVMRYRSFAQKRFDQYSKGGGDWPPLAKATKLARARRTVDRAVAYARHLTEEEAQRRIRRAKRRYQKEAAKINSGEGTYAILKDYGLLFAALSPTFREAPGALEHHVPFGVEVGYGGPARHPDPDGKSKNPPTIADIAAFHQSGGPHLPRREIIVTPPQGVVNQMAGDMDLALQRVAKRLNAD